MKTLKITLAFSFLLFFCHQISAQGVGVNPTGAQPDASAGLDVDFSDKGFLMPRLSNAQRDAISNPADGCSNAFRLYCFEQ